MINRLNNSLLALTALLIFCQCGPKWEETSDGEIKIVKNEGGKTLGYHFESGVTLLTVDRYAFKDLNKNGQLDPYEDWRLSHEERAQNLSSLLSIEEIAGLMLYSAHQSIPARSEGYFAGTYNGQKYIEGETDPSDLTDQQKKFLEEDHLRHVLITTVKSPEDAAKWNNKLQAFCEGLGKGIPANNSSDPRHGTQAKAEYDAAAGGEISMWPSSLGLAATFDPGLVEKFGEIASEEYRNLGITTALSPQVDIATEPRWMRFSGTFGESPELSAEMAKAYCDGFQSKEWGGTSVNAMVKHWPGGGSGEGGRDAHYGSGKYAVYPGDNFEEHLTPFLEGAFALEGSTKMAAAIMPYYTISWKQDKEKGENVGNAYSEYLISDLLREKYGYNGVVCTDWGITRDHRAMDVFIDGHSWGVETMTEVERHFKLLKAGVDQFGGNNEAQPIVDAYQLGIKEFGEAEMRSRMEESARRLLLNIFRVGLFENPYLNVEKTNKIVGKPEFMKEGYDAQLKSVVMLKNQGNILPLDEKKTVYIPERFVPASRNFLGMETPEYKNLPVELEMAKKFFNITDNPDEADVALVFIQNPRATIGYDAEDVRKGGNGYIPISLQYNDYIATEAREESIAGGDPLEDFVNRSYKNKSASTANITDAELVAQTKRLMKDKPVVVSLQTGNPMIFGEIEKFASSILVHFGVQDQAVFDLMSGKSEPSALLPMQMPIDMSTVERQAEDVPFDMNVYIDSEGNSYDFGFGMNWRGVISDDRTQKFLKN